MGQFLAFTDAVPCVRLSSEDGLAWTGDATTGINIPLLLAVNPDSGRIVAVQADGNIKYSDDDGFNWTDVGFNVGIISIATLRLGTPRIWYKNGKFYVCSGSGTGRYRLAISADDGVTWNFTVSRSPYDLYAPGPGNTIYAASISTSAYITSTDDFATASGALVAPVAIVRDIVYIESLNRLLFLGAHNSNPNWHFSNPTASGVVTRGSAYISETIWSETFSKVLFGDQNSNNLSSAPAGGPFTVVNAGAAILHIAEGNGFAIAPTINGTFLKITDPTVVPTSVLPAAAAGFISYAALYLDTVSVPDMEVETIAPLPEFSAEFELYSEITAEFAAPLPIFYAEASSSMRIDVEFVSPMPEFAAALERSDFEFLYFDTFGIMPLFSSTSATQADMTIGTSTPLAEFSTQIIVPPVAGYMDTVAPMPEFSAIISRPGIALETLMLMPVFEALVGEAGDLEITLGFSNFQLNIYTEGEYNSVLTFVQVL